MARTWFVSALAGSSLLLALAGAGTSSAVTPGSEDGLRSAVSQPAPPAGRGPVAEAPQTGPRAGHGQFHSLAGGCWYASSHWWCNNVSGAGVYINSNGQAQYVGTMYSNPSWFVCRSDAGGYVGGPHPYRWEWTQADNGAWGWMKDTDIYSETDPLPVC